MLLFEYLKASGHGAQARMLLSSGRVYYRGLPTADPMREVAPEDVAVRPQAPPVQVGRAPVLLYQDSALMVAFKPPGMLSTTQSRRSDISLVASMQRRFGTILPAYELHEAVSGLMVVALAKGAQRAIQEQLASGAAERGHQALVVGGLPEPERTVRDTLVLNRGDGLAGRGTGPGAVPAVTHLRQVEDLGRYALVEARQETFQPGQLRIHLAELDAPIVGDPDYAPGRAARALPRIAINAHKLAFDHPTSGKRLSFTLPLPDDLDQARRKMLRGKL